VHLRPNLHPDPVSLLRSTNDSPKDIVYGQMQYLMSFSVHLHLMPRTDAIFY
jgi:hypothetical protein